MNAQPRHDAPFVLHCSYSSPSLAKVPADASRPPGTHAPLKLMLPISWNGERFGITLLGECFTRQMRTCFFSSLHSCDRWC
nr:unnamed protein product [Digitaria exilis]